MSDRITKKHVESAFQALCTALNKRVATAYNDVGAWSLDHAPNGYMIEEVHSSGGGVSHPIDSRRRSAREMYEACWFAVNAIRTKEGK